MLRRSGHDGNVEVTSSSLSSATTTPTGKLSTSTTTHQSPRTIRSQIKLFASKANHQYKQRSSSLIMILLLVPMIGLVIIIVLFASVLQQPPTITTGTTIQSSLSSSATISTPKSIRVPRIKNDSDGGGNIIQSESDSNNEKEEDVIGTTTARYHIVFSTGCSMYQDWQSYVFFYHAMISKQSGIITRIVSGCTEEQQVQLERIFEDEIRSIVEHEEDDHDSTTANNNNNLHPKNDRFRIHFTPDYSRLKASEQYVYFNKPYGMKHWFENALGFPNNIQDEQQDTIVILMDPDQLIMRPFENNDFGNAEWKYIPDTVKPRTRIDHGYPMGQLYGFGLQWKEKIDMKIVLQSLNMSLVTPIDTMAKDEAKAGYIMGPPYVATAKDMYQIVQTWSDFVVPVHDQYPHLLAEMFAYCLAAAHLQLSHQTAVSFMVSDIGSGKAEGWNYIDQIPEDEICSRSYSPDELPSVLHYCQRYGIGPYFFGKHRVPGDYLSCQSPLFQEPPIDALTQYDYALYPNNDRKMMTNVEHKKRYAFMTCYILPAMNAAATYYKQHHCDDATNVANYSKSILLGAGGY
jgi:peptidyl serine alpha-galactosyltransferase